LPRFLNFSQQADCLSDGGLGNGVGCIPGDIFWQPVFAEDIFSWPKMNLNRIHPSAVPTNWRGEREPLSLSNAHVPLSTYRCYQRLCSLFALFHGWWWSR